ncbi:hypothetical protein SteCoe_24594 [Stentor coeruleus]|uniref:Uncharacterized protein n=1 Tax=Stentor coeruleus TaxID=5963 RepID=A0A1R2BH40_9CILI|nr:hypothetical protein SteCoe_24594 [Stentor coeruleus]
MGSCISKTKPEENTAIGPEVMTIQRPKIRSLNLPVVIPKSHPKNRLRLFVVREASQEDTIRSPMIQ